MRIRKLRLSGFKSFVEPAELLIEPGLTGVVGPNGCGKSNLLEAIRWVMGESSARSMRGAGMEDVIFAGTAARPARDFAEVTIFAERSGEGDADRQLEVTRRIERGAGSAYRLDGRDVRAKDVALIFADAATGAHSPALVSQGRISAVIAAKPAERRQMLEEAAGIAGLHVRRKDAEQKLRAAEANLGRLDDLLGDMEARSGALRRQARAAERYRLLSADIRVAEARLIFARWRDAAAAAETAKGQTAAAEQAVQDAAEAQRAAAAHQGEAARRLGAARAAAEQAREAASTVGHRLAALAAEREALDRRIGDLGQRREALEQDRAREDRLSRDAAAAIAALAEEEKALAAALAANEARCGATEARVRTADDIVRDGEVEMACALAAQATEQADIRVAEAALGAARQRLERAAAECAQLDRDLQAIGEEAPLVFARDTARAAQARAAEAQDGATRALAEAETARAAAAVARDAAEAAVGSQRAALAALEGEARALVKTLESGHSQDRALAHVRPAPGYERALAAALGDDLDATIGGGAAGRRWAGAAVDAGDPPLPAGTVPLADHVAAPAELARRLRQVGVVETDDGTLALAVGQRLVTRAGRLRRWDGLIAEEAGAAVAERLIRINRLAELETLLPEARRALDAAVAGKDRAGGALAEAQARIEAARTARQQAEAAARTAIRDEDAASAALERMQRQRGDIDARAALADGERVAAEAAVVSAEAARRALPDGANIRAEVETLRAAAETARAALIEARSAAAALAQGIEADGRRIQAVRGEAKSWRARAGDAARRIDDMAKRAAAIAVEEDALSGRPAALTGEIAALGERNDAARADADAARAAEAAAEAALRETERLAAAAGETLAAQREARAGAIARLENQESRRIEMGRISAERFECPAPVLPEKIGFAGAEVGEAQGESARLERLNADRERIGPVNLVAEQELAELEQSRATSQAEREELGQAINRLRGSIGSLNREGRARLLAAFEAVDRHFRRLFATLFGGGEAHLALIDSDDPLEAGLEIMAQPPGKKLATLTLLSGGEQALTAVALIFALFLTNPAPICVLDEVDAPLDDANIERFCDLLDRMVVETDTRYLIVTHNAVTMARMHRLFGVTMIERGVSRLVSVDLGAAETLLAAE